MGYCIECNKEVTPVPGRDFHVIRSSLSAGEDVPYSCGPVYETKAEALLSQVRILLDDAESLLASGEDWAHDAAWITLTDSGGLMDWLRKLLDYMDEQGPSHD